MTRSSKTACLARGGASRPASRQRVFITGASSGIGAALARRYAARGDELGLVGRRRDALQALVDGLPGQGHRVYALDVRDRAALHAAAQDFLAAGPVDLVIASAGISAGTLTDAPEDYAVFEAILDTNVLAMVATFEPFIAPMRARGSGTLAGIGSVAGVRGLPGAGAYSASKAAVRAYCESLRVELHGTGVRVVTLAPGFIASPMTDALNEQQKAGILSTIPACRLGEGSDIAAACVFLASDQAGYVTGQTLHVNGGMAMI